MKPKADLEWTAKALYDRYRMAVGGVAFNGSPLPDWLYFRTDPTKTKQANAWLEVARLALELYELPEG